MRALVVYDSRFGNTERIARAVGRGLEPYGAVRVVSVAGQGPAGIDADLLVVGAPTQVRGMARRELQRLLDRLAPAALDGKMAAAFDTRVSGRRLVTGSAATALARRLEVKGARLAAAAESFLVTPRGGALLEGEEARAEAWGRGLAEALAAPRAAVGQGRRLRVP